MEGKTIMKFLLSILLSCMLTSCTLSFQNISTHGTATDLVDDTDTQSIDPTLQFPDI